MEALGRKPFQGISNIIRFNWHYYAIAFAIIVTLTFAKQHVFYELDAFATVFILLTITSMSISLAVSHYIYDCSPLYTLNWINHLHIKPGNSLVNINAGFDETSKLLVQKYPYSSLKVLDFYDPDKHTEISIKRARKAYPMFPGTKRINTTTLPLNANSVNYIFLILTAHEIRDLQERILFFNQLQSALRQEGRIVVVEHLRDVYNFIAYNFGFFHFFSKRSWRRIFEEAGLREVQEIKITPFISAFILEKNGITS